MGTRVLVIEGGEAVASVITAGLQMQGMECTLCISLGLGLLELRKSSYDLIVLDGDSGMAGRALLSTLRRWSDAPVIILVASLSNEEAAQWREAGANQLMLKPFSASALAQRASALAAAAGPTSSPWPASPSPAEAERSQRASW